MERRHAEAIHMLHDYACMPHMNAEHLLTKHIRDSDPPNGGNFGLAAA